ncbi:MAG TPA: DUF6328 family protein [Usitatibacter sp.]|nr:DUF6328 family protein [Usitatibacter sp.]
MANAPSRSDESLEKRAEAAIQESRMVLPGIQTLFGFQLIAGFNQGFRELAVLEQHLHYASLILTALAIAIIMTPAAYHRSIGVQVVTQQFIRNSTRLLLASMPPLGVAISVEFYIVGRLIFDAAWPAIVGAVLCALFFFMWLALPRSKALQDRLDRLPGAKH